MSWDQSSCFTLYACLTLFVTSQRWTGNCNHTASHMIVYSSKAFSFRIVVDRSWVEISRCFSTRRRRWSLRRGTVRLSM
jgi:hypothetical protein